MAFDIQLSYPQQLVKISSVSLVEGADEPTIRVIGDDFSAVDEVLLNDIASPHVVVVSNTELLAVIPVEVRGSKLMTVVVVSYRVVYTKQSIVSFRVGGTNRKVSGINRLIQLFLKVLLTTPGSDIFHPGVGGGALRIVGKTISKDAAQSLVGDFVVAVDNTAKQVVAMQSKKSRTPQSERLLSAQVQGARFDESQTALIVTILLVSQAGTVASANLVL
jgi:hypothetical protein